MGVTATRQLSAGELTALAALETRVVSADGGRLKLEWGALQARPGNVTRDFTWCEDGRLAGFLGLYAFGTAKVEIAGMVDPEQRRRGIATALLEAALPVCREHGGDSVLLVVPRNSDAGRALAIGRGAELEHSEHVLVLEQAPERRAEDPLITLRDATEADFESVSALLLSGFGHPAADPSELAATDRARTVIIEREGAVAGTIRVTYDGEAGRVYGFVVAEELRGQGIGGDVLARVCRSFFQTGAREVGLEVSVGNDHALNLYLSLGFKRFVTEDYYELAL